MFFGFSKWYWLKIGDIAPLRINDDNDDDDDDDDDYKSVALSQQQLNRQHYLHLIDIKAPSLPNLSSIGGKHRTLLIVTKILLGKRGTCDIEIEFSYESTRENKTFLPIPLLGGLLHRPPPFTSNSRPSQPFIAVPMGKAGDHYISRAQY